MLHSRSLALLLLALLLPAIGTAQPRPTPKLEAVAETQLLMEGLTLANFRGLDKILRERPADAQTWTFARGQALLIAESGNLLMLRPPRNPQGQDAWMKHATELREAATKLARQCGARELDASRAALLELATSCNRCHETFRVTARIRAFAEPKD